MVWFRRKKKEPKIEVIRRVCELMGIPKEFQLKLDTEKLIPDKFNFEIGKIPKIEVSISLPSDITINHKHDIPSIRIDHKGGGANLAPQTAGKPSIDQEALQESIRERKALTAERINELLKTKGESIRALRQRYWDEYLRYDRQRQAQQALYFKIKVEAIDEILKEDK